MSYADASCPQSTSFHKAADFGANLNLSQGAAHRAPVSQCTQASFYNRQQCHGQAAWGPDVRALLTAPPVSDVGPWPSPSTSLHRHFFTGILVFYCHVTDYPKRSSLKQHPLLNSQFPLSWPDSEPQEPRRKRPPTTDASTYGTLLTNSSSDPAPHTAPALAMSHLHEASSSLWRRLLSGCQR